ncbi:hypothetical protein SAMN04489859_101932 [Paracoccus alcaliphilus]|uniref:Uncharacterized protein n=1 Tax=Paracoccus alcaliphilus TaxID=34002 RepID=A0A1H8JWV7_9RHOB|nr:hypothetical protein [Paracoccus alcaliphilus]WCR20530.1 hypothetical protein JHW40_21775 [Paracoccus alcaliphilus]SEN85170.1 hypothetical protein SAMN04489859_101932 [Paracoccus alcaliphilus]
MIPRPVLLAALIALTAPAFAQQPPAQETSMIPAAEPLNPSDALEATRAKLARQLIGLAPDAVAGRLAEAGAQGVAVTDLAAMDLAPGTDLGDGLRAGDQVLSVTFGLRRGFFRPDQRFLLDLGHDGSVVTDLLGLKAMPK